MKRIVILSFVVVTSAFLVWKYVAVGVSFRGYNSNSKCQDVLEAERVLGSVQFSNHVEHIEYDGEISVTELNTDLYGHPTVVQVGCRPDSSVYGIWYVAETDVLDDQWRIYDDFSASLDAQFGPSDEFVSGPVRTKGYVCSDRGGLFLGVGSHDPNMQTGEVSILVSLERSPCL